MRKVLWMLLACMPLCGQSEDPIARYFELRNECPAAFGEAGDWQLGESQTIVDEETMLEVQAEYFQEFLGKGLSQEEAARRTQLGVVCEDGYWIWIREALRFPSGHCDIYNRFIHKYSLRSSPGQPVVCSVILAQLPNEKIAVNLMFRNGTRSWEIELPRGGIDAGESSEEAARREILEETGYAVENPSYLGSICLDSALIPHFFHLYFAKTAKLGAIDREEGEVIASVLAFSKEELKLALARGQMEEEVNGRKVTAFCRDHHMAYAILLAETKGLL